MPPPVAKTAKMRRPSALVGPQRNRNLGDLRTELRRLDDELRRKLHSRASQIHLVVNRTRKSAHAAVTVSNPRVEEKIEQAREPGIADIFVVPRHRSAFDFAAKAIAHHHVVTLSPHFDKTRNISEVVAVV